MRQIGTITLLLSSVSISACNHVVIETPPAVNCTTVGANIDKQKGVKASDQLNTVEILACYYGASSAMEEIACTIPVYPPKYFNEGDDTYGLRDNSAAQLIVAEGYGSRQAWNTALWMAAHRVDPHDTDSCLRHIHDVPESFEKLVAATKQLKPVGY